MHNVSYASAYILSGDGWIRELDKIQQDLNAKAKDWNLIKTMVKN